MELSADYAGRGPETAAATSRRDHYAACVCALGLGGAAAPLGPFHTCY